MTQENHFIWGVATSSFQIEGATHEDGRGSSIWDTFCAQPGKIFDRSNGDVACEHFHRLEEDLNLIQSLGVNAYRFSIAWPRILPQGTGLVELRGLDFYERLIDGLLKRNIQPFPTLYHWDLPQALQDLGGWTHEDLPAYFADYASVVTQKFADRITHWTTLNEPHVFCYLGYELGVHAPGHTSRKEHLQAIRNALRAHGLAAKTIRSIQTTAKVGIANCYPLPQALNSHSEEAADWADQITNRIYFDPILLGTVPPFVREQMECVGVVISETDMQDIRDPLDFVGINYYNRMMARPGGFPEKPFILEHPRYPGARITDIGWEHFPQGLLEVLHRMRDRYPSLPVYITENGAAYNLGPDTQGQIHDKDRVDFYQTHLESIDQARKDGCLIGGYFAWSLMDNFEWSHGYSQRFGLVHVDYKTQKRTLKDSALWYKKRIGKT